jgi:hypothetical protein
LKDIGCALNAAQHKRSERARFSVRHRVLQCSANAAKTRDREILAQTKMKLRKTKPPDLRPAVCRKS